MTKTQNSSDIQGTRGTALGPNDPHSASFGVTSIAAPRTVTKTRNRDRCTTCRSCRAAATVLICVDGKIYNSSCARHEALNTRRAVEGKE